jgi:hypothetical protein
MDQEMNADFNVVAVTKDQYEELIKHQPDTVINMSIITDTGVLESQEFLIIGLCMVSDGTTEKETLKIANLRTGKLIYLEPEEE